MKGIHRIYGIAITFLALWIAINADAPTKCPYPSEKFPENTTTNLPHETDCTKFYKCFFGRPIKQDCPLMIKDDPVSRLHYNREKQVCDWPWEAGCHVCPPKVNGKWPDAKLPAEDGDCKKYYICKNGEPIEDTCKEKDECFSRTCQACRKHREGGNCSGKPPISNSTSTSTSTTTTSTTTTTTEKPTTPTTTKTTTEYPCYPDRDRKAHECNCHKFYECNIDAGGWVLDTCYGGLHFSPTKKLCVEADESGCKLINI